MTENKTPIGQIMIARGLLDASRLDALIAERAISEQRLCSLAFAKEIADEQQLLRCLAIQQGFPGAALNASIVDLSLLRMIPQVVAQRYSLLPICLQNGQLSVVMADPTRKDIIDEIAFVTGHKVIAYVGLKGIIDVALPSVYQAFDTGEVGLLRGPLADAATLSCHVHEVTGLADLEDESLIIDEDDIVGMELAGADDEEEVPLVVGTVTSSEHADSADSSGVDDGADDGGAAKILVVDDEADIRQLLQTALRSKSYQVELAERGLEALQKIKKWQPDLVLLDAMLPEVHGFEICQKIKTSKRFSQVPVIMITAVYKGWRYAQDVRKTYGADDYIEKPFSIADLLRRVDAQLVRASKLVAFEQPEQEQIEALRRQGHSAHKAGQHEQALQIFRQAIELDPFDARLHFMLGMSLQARRETFAAIQEFERAVDLAPDLYPALKNLAVLYERKGFSSKAIEMWERALANGSKAQQEQARKQLQRLLA